MGIRATRIRVLLVDDHEDTREMYGSFLASTGMEVKTAPDGATGLVLAREWRPHVVVMDWAMPAVTGDEATRELKADPRTRHIRVLMLTAFGVARRAELEAAGADAVCAKPCNPMELEALVRKLAAGLAPEPPRKPPAGTSAGRGRAKRGRTQ